MTDGIADGQDLDIVGLLSQSGLTAADQRLVRNVLANNMIESWTLDRQAVLRLLAFAAGRTDAKRAPKADPEGARDWRRHQDVANLFDGPPDPDWAGDRELVDNELRPPCQNDPRC